MEDIGLCGNHYGPIQRHVIYLVQFFVSTNISFLSFKFEPEDACCLMCGLSNSVIIRDFC